METRTLDLQKIYQLLEMIDEIRPWLDSNVVREFVSYLEKIVAEVQLERLVWLDEEKARIESAINILGQSTAATLITKVEEQIILIENIPAKREKFLEGDTVGDKSLSRVLPVFVMVDNSTEADAREVREVEECVISLVKDLTSIPEAYEFCEVAIITLALPARVEIPLTNLSSLKIPQLERVAQQPDLVGAFLALRQMLLNQGNANNYKPVALLLTKGSFYTPLEEILAAKSKCLGNGQLMVIVCGRNPNLNALRELSSTVYPASDIGPGFYSRLLKFISESRPALSRTVHLPTPPWADLMDFADDED